MISKLTCLIFSCLFILVVHAQPVLTGSAPKIGYMLEAYTGSSVNPGNAGANVTWDFSTISLPNTASAMVVLPSTTPYYAQYSTSNFAIKIYSGSYNAYNYYNYDNTKLDIMATNVGGFAETDHSLDNRLWVKLPFNYLDAAADTWKIDTASYTDSIMYDGYGTLITPFHTFHNVVRVKALTYNTTGLLNTTYTWFKSDSLFQIMSIDDNSSLVLDLPLPTSIKHTPNQKKVILYPNPAVNTITIDAGISDGTITITDVVGRQLKSLPVKNKPVALDIADMNPGIYSYTLQDNNTGEIYNGRFVVSR